MHLLLNWTDTTRKMTTRSWIKVFKFDHSIMSSLMFAERSTTTFYDKNCLCVEIFRKQTTNYLERKRTNCIFSHIIHKLQSVTAFLITFFRLLGQSTVISANKNEKSFTASHYIYASDVTNIRISIVNVFCDEITMQLLRSVICLFR